MTHTQSVAPTAQWLVYILQCADGSLYTGVTNNLDRRCRQHAAGKASRYTRSRLPVRIVYVETQPSQGAALRRELAIKQLTRPEKLAMIGPLVANASPTADHGAA